MKLKSTSIGIIGGGPAGISAARFLIDQGYSQVTVLEKNGSVGGKSWSVEHEGLVHEMGTCYSSIGYEQTMKWMKEVNVQNINLEPAMVNGQDFRAYAYNGKSKLAALREVLRYRKFWKMHRKGRLSAEEYSKPTLQWMQEQNFDILIRTLHRGMTTMGYGFLDEVALHHTLTWVNPKLLLTGVLNRVYEPVQGWQALWERMAESMDVRLNCRVIQIDRSGAKPKVVTASDTFEFDELLITIPLDEVAQLMPVNEQEQQVIDAVEWGALKTTLVATHDWFQNEFVRIYPQQVALGSSATLGRLIAVRRTSTKKLPGQEYGNTTPGYICLQYGGSHSSETVLQYLKDELKKEGVQSHTVVAERLWKYMPFLKHEALLDGILDTMQEMQGHRNIWYSGATFSHESIRDIVDFNRKLAKQMVSSPKPATTA